MYHAHSITSHARKMTNTCVHDEDNTLSNFSKEIIVSTLQPPSKAVCLLCVFACKAYSQRFFISAGET